MKGARPGWHDYADMLRSIIDRPSTAIELSDKHGMKADSMRDLLRSMRALKLVHVPTMATALRGKLMRGYAFGDGPSVDPLTYRTRTPNIELIAFAEMLRALSRAPQSSVSLASAAGVSSTRAGVLLAHLRVIGLAYIAVWDRRRSTGGKPTARHLFGIDQPHACRPVALSAKENDRNDRQRKAARRRQADRLRALCANASVFTIAA